MTDNEPKAYIPAPMPPAPVKDSGIGGPIQLAQGGIIELSPTDRQLLADIRQASAAVTATAREKQKAEILARFERRNLSVETIKEIENSTSIFRSTAKYILEVTKPGREQSAALTALEEAKFWTNQSIALNGVAA